MTLPGTYFALLVFLDEGILPLCLFLHHVWEFPLFHPVRPAGSWGHGAVRSHLHVDRLKFPEEAAIVKVGMNK